MKRYKNNIIAILGIILSAIGIVIALAWHALKPLNQKNGFNRKIFDPKLTIQNILNKPKDVNGLAGITGQTLYFRTNKPTSFFVSDFQLSDTHRVIFNIPLNRKILSRFHSNIDSPNMYVFAGNVPAIIQAQKNKPATVYPFPSQIYMRAISISPTLFIFRGFDSSVKTIDPIFFKGNPATRAITKENNISEMNNDAGISTDGHLYYDKKTNSIIYFYSYKNQFICMDTNLNLLYKTHTIDTFNTAQSSAGKINSQNVITNLLPKRLINAWSAVDNGYIYNLSRLKADNETIDDLNNNAIIDIYKIKDGKYIGSFYIPKYQSESIRKLYVSNQNIIALYKNHIINYSLPVIINEQISPQ